MQFSRVHLIFVFQIWWEGKMQHWTSYLGKPFWLVFGWAALFFHHFFKCIMMEDSTPLSWWKSLFQLHFIFVSEFKIVFQSQKYSMNEKRLSFEKDDPQDDWHNCDGWIEAHLALIRLDELIYCCLVLHLITIFAPPPFRAKNAFCR